ncbi:GGDEF domain-containing protein [Vibrio algarum]|uniref:diguanylate cyclase n=1 Tax=Vibrio algarum TaxID=3020714 RepID=A0ABT4YXQ1_9VIBR|nr:GGDEF domain-containing protein [Vibrio sp. KJ40-1]MDB1125758.1 GGDEF domain-containing protein [Vibrio sp. KJ40-1]
MTRTNLTNGYVILFGSDISDLKNTQSHLEKANLRVEALAITDQLTGINNRRSMDTVSEHEIKRARRYKQPLSVLMLDLDHFKLVNDSYGHNAGDFILREFAYLCTQQLRETDFIFRVGGEEFTILLPMTDIATAYTIGERIRLFTESHIFYFKELNQKIDISVSIGISCFSDTSPSFKELMTQADKALYKAKQNGRNQVCAYSNSEST